MDRPDPLDLLERSHDRRLPQLAPVRWARMLTSPFAYLRGSAMVMAWDLAHLPHSQVEVQACGDAHLCNFGVWASPERRLLFDLRDFDETLPGPWEWDIKRLVASVAVAGRERGMPPWHVERAVRAAARAYRGYMRAALGMTHLDVWYRHIDADSVQGATRASRRYAQRTFAKARRRTSRREMDRLTVVDGSERRIKEDRPLIFPLTDHLIADDMRAVLRAYASTLSLDRQVLFERYHLVDMAYRVVGVGSVGTRCLVALFAGDSDDDPLFLQIKEASRSVLEPFWRPSRFENQGERVVRGQRLLQAASDLLLGWKSSGGHDFYVRQLKDMKGTMDLEDMDGQVIVEFAGLCGRTLAHAHARTGDFCQIAGYLGRTDRFDTALVQFANEYADQVERDHAALATAVRMGRLPVALGA
jgi:uncharacterized protein (DUF2252 family)